MAKSKIPLIKGQQFSQPWRPQILLLKEKHGDRAFDATTVEALHKSALAIVKERLNEQWYYEPENDSTPPEMTEAAIAALPNGPIKQAGLLAWVRYKTELQEYKIAQGDWQLVQDAIKNNDGKAAWDIIRSRQDHEYENYRLIRIETGDPDLED